MNVERLGAIALAVQKDLDDLNIGNLLNELIGALNNVINSPNDGHQKQLIQARERLYTALGQMAFDQFPATWRTDLIELGIAGKLGISLKQQIEHSFAATNDSLLAEVRDYVVDSLNTMNGFRENFGKLNEAIDGLRIPRETELLAGSAVASVLMPKLLVSGSAISFSKRVAEAARTLKHIEHVTSGRSPEDPTLVSISSSDPTIIMGVRIATLLGLLMIVEKSLNSISAAYDVAIKREELAQLEVESSVIEALDDLPQISGPVSMREPGRFEGKAIWP